MGLSYTWLCGNSWVGVTTRSKTHDKKKSTTDEHIETLLIVAKNILDQVEEPSLAEEEPSQAEEEPSIAQEEPSLAEEKPSLAC